MDPGSADEPAVRGDGIAASQRELGEGIRAAHLAPGWRAEIRTRSAPGRASNASDLQVRVAPGSPWRVWPLLGRVEDQDSELTAGEGRSGAETGTVQRMGIVGDQ